MSTLTDAADGLDRDGYPFGATMLRKIDEQPDEARAAFIIGCVIGVSQKRLPQLQEALSCVSVSELLHGDTDDWTGPTCSIHGSRAVYQDDDKLANSGSPWGCGECDTDRGGEVKS